MSDPTDAPSTPDPVRLAFARIEGWKAVCLVVLLLAAAGPKTYHDSSSWGQDPLVLGWRTLCRASPFGTVLPWIVVKVLVVHLLAAVWFRRRPGARLSAAQTLLIWGASTVLDALVLWGTGEALWERFFLFGAPFGSSGFWSQGYFESLLTPRMVLFMEAWLGVLTLACALGPYMLYRGMRARAQDELIGHVQTHSVSQVGTRALRIALLVGSLVAFLALPWALIRTTTGWPHAYLQDRSPGLLFLAGDEGPVQSAGAAQMFAALACLLGLAMFVRPRVLVRGWPERFALLGAETACLLAWGVGYALLAFPPLEWLTTARWQRATEVAPFLGFQLLVLCTLETLWFCIRRRSTD